MTDDQREKMSNAGSENPNETSQRSKEELTWKAVTRSAGGVNTRHGDSKKQAKGEPGEEREGNRISTKPPAS